MASLGSGTPLFECVLLGAAGDCPFSLVFKLEPHGEASPTPGADGRHETLALNLCQVRQGVVEGSECDLHVGGT